MILTKRDKTMLIILIAAIAGSVLMLTVGRQMFLGGAPAEEIKLTPVPSVDADFLNDPRFKGLVAPKGLPVEAGKTGNSNPFGIPTAEAPQTAPTGTPR